MTIRTRVSTGEIYADIHVPASYMYLHHTCTCIIGKHWGDIRRQSEKERDEARIHVFILFLVTFHVFILFLVTFNVFILFLVTFTVSQNNRGPSADSFPFLI